MPVRVLITRTSHSLLVRMQSGTATSEDSLAVSYKTKPTLTLCSTIHYLPWYLPKGGENLHPHKNLHTDVLAAIFIIARM